MRNNFPLFTLGIILTPILGFICYFLFKYSESASSIPLYIFPWAYLGNFFGIELPSGFLLLGFLQLPIYGLLIDVTKGKYLRFLVFATIVISHILLIKFIP